MTSEQLDLRPVLRTGELLEVVPGLIVTQHSGDGKANQYFLRGFNLDHGTDLATSVDGVPVNMPTHAHGQGYTDINFVIPELVESIEYRKGTYYAETGNFSAAGAVNMRYRDGARRAVRGRRSRRGRLSARPARRARRRSAAARCCWRSSTRTTMVRGCWKKTFARPTRCCAIRTTTAGGRFA